MPAEELCMEILGQRAEGDPLLLCALPVDHDGDHDPNPPKFADGDEPLVRETQRKPNAPVELELSCAQCGQRFVIEMPSGSRLADKLAQHLKSTAADQLCEGCADIAERAAGEVTEVEVFENRLAASGVPKKWQRQTFAMLDDDEERSRAVELAMEWASGEIQGLVLWGEVGRGKTAIAAAAANAALHRRRVRWVAVSELLMALRMGFDSPEYHRAIRSLDPGRGGPGLASLVLDDLDKLKPTEHAVQPLYTAINAWIEADAPLLVTLNRDLDDLAEWLPETFRDAIGSRLAGYCKVRQVRGIDRRLPT